MKGLVGLAVYGMMGFAPLAFGEAPTPSPYPPMVPPAVGEELFRQGWIDAIRYNLRDIEEGADIYAGWCAYVHGGGTGQDAQQNLPLARDWYAGALQRWADKNVTAADFHDGRYGITYAAALQRLHAAQRMVARACR